MSESTAKVSVKCYVQGGVATEGVALILRRTRSQRIARALKVSSLVFVLGAILLFVPVIHLIGALLILVGVPLSGWLSYRESSSRIGGEAACPKCGSKMEFIRGREEWPFFHVCGDCDAMVRIERDA